MRKEKNRQKKPDYPCLILIGFRWDTSLSNKANQRKKQLNLNYPITLLVLKKMRTVPEKQKISKVLNWI